MLKPGVIRRGEHQERRTQLSYPTKSLELRRVHDLAFQFRQIDITMNGVSHDAERNHKEGRLLDLTLIFGESVENRIRIVGVVGA